MDRLTDIRGIASHLHRKADFADQIAGVGADNAAAENPMVRFVKQQLGEPSSRPLAMARPEAAQGKRICHI